MLILYLIIFFILGTIFGSFFTVVGLRLPKKESFISNRSYCDKCHHELSFMDMIPIISFLSLKGRCRYCHSKISDLSTYMEFFTGVLFALSYFAFGFSYELFIALGIVAMLIIISVSDITYYVIPDEILIFFSGYFVIITCLQNGVIAALLSIGSGIILFTIIYLIMFLGNAIFKKETLGGGDVKMMFVFGLLLNPVMGLVVIFIASFIALPVSLLILYRSNKDLIPFGPFLLIGFTFIYFTGVDITSILGFLT